MESTQQSTVEETNKNLRTRKDAIGEDELYLHRKAIENHGNNWKEIMNFMYRNGQFLPPAVFSKYKAGVEDEKKRKPIRSRIANLGRKVKNSPEVVSRERTNVYTTLDSSPEEMAVKMQHAKEQEAADPLVDSPHGLSDESDYAEPSMDTKEQPRMQTGDHNQPTPKTTKKRKSGGKTKLDELMEQANKMMEEARKASRTHTKYLKTMAADKGIHISSESD